MNDKEVVVWLKECKEHYGEYHEKCDEALDIAIKALKERPQGEWITENIKEPYGKCNQCGEICEVDNYCGNCGAKMRVKDELNNSV